MWVKRIFLESATRSRPTTFGERPRPWFSALYLSFVFAAFSNLAWSQTSPATASTAADDGKREVQDITFDNLKFEMEVGGDFDREMLTDEIEGLLDSTIRIKGFIRPSFKQSGLTKFIFVRDDQACCFGPGAALYDCILVELAEGKSTDFTVRPITIKGHLYFQEFTGPDGNIWAIYRMREAVVE